MVWKAARRALHTGLGSKPRSPVRRTRSGFAGGGAGEGAEVVLGADGVTAGPAVGGGHAGGGGGVGGAGWPGRKAISRRAQLGVAATELVRVRRHCRAAAASAGSVAASTARTRAGQNSARSEAD